MPRGFRGEQTAKVDAKGRVSVPPMFRRILEEGDPDWMKGLTPNFVLVYGRPELKAIEGYTMQSIAEVDRMIEALPQFSFDRERLSRMLNTKSLYAQLDEPGRMTLPQRLRDEFGIADEVLFAGMGATFQIWAPDAFERNEREAAEAAAGRETDLYALLNNRGGPAALTAPATAPMTTVVP